jgi:hypothetical protein
VVDWRYERLDAAQFVLGREPFHARGLAYVNALRYVDERTPGGRQAFRGALGPDRALCEYYDQIFLVTGEYDVSPLVILFRIAAQLEGTPVSRFIQERARWSGRSDPRGVWKPKLHGGEPGDVASKLHFAFERYFPPCGAEVREATSTRFAGELRRLPEPLNGVYVQSTIGFFQGALEDAGARDVLARFHEPASDGVYAGVPVQRIAFTVHWHAPGVGRART